MRNFALKACFVRCVGKVRDELRARPIFRLIVPQILLAALLIACGRVTTPLPTVSPFQHAAQATESNESELGVGIHVWSLGGNGWALELGNKLLIFDYVEGTDPNPPAADEARNLQRGYIDTEEIKDYETYVFVTHSHPDHYDPIIIGWQDMIDDITFFFGWGASEDPEHHYLIGPRAHIRSGSVEVFTINSHHAGVPEVAYLVKTDGLTIYHNGDYMASYVEDFEYLKTASDHIDIAFVIGWPYTDHQQFQQALLLNEMFSPKYMFAICREGDEERCGQFANLLAEHGVDAAVQYAEQRGDQFFIPQSEIETHTQ
jgi:L-ascorbate metabolism protein UlaG (beta-lactamase superfamily)